MPAAAAQALPRAAPRPPDPDNSQPLPADPRARDAEVARRRVIVEKAHASASIEGGAVSPAARAIAERWVTGEIDMRAMVEETGLLHGTR